MPAGSGITTDTAKVHNGDAALALSVSLEAMHQGFKQGEEVTLLQKIDLMILSFLAVCYALYYGSGSRATKGKRRSDSWLYVKIDKPILSYAAIFGIEDDLNLSDTEYSWLSSVFWAHLLLSGQLV
ncbi:uncharacterized protein N7482_007951 [Penicillium canariense]|uniref:Uncharacterized protein n=1 Tax=Penicillium canariense TaxID=189055 RepID=A0A9W9I0M9_9EURO|nr:uncharacterized protein N7482_007951 [Penicillium canariense]KAJ5160947.1 hypothetical protein N7482_007951 [Penicillium canariense]